MSNNLIISEDENTVTHEAQVFQFNEIPNPDDEDFNECGQCDAYNLCCQLQTTVKSEFPFPCVERKDGRIGNFKAV